MSSPLILPNGLTFHHELMPQYLQNVFHCVGKWPEHATFFSISNHSPTATISYSKTLSIKNWLSTLLSIFIFSERLKKIYIKLLFFSSLLLLKGGGRGLYKVMVACSFNHRLDCTDYTWVSSGGTSSWVKILRMCLKQPSAMSMSCS